LPAHTAKAEQRQHLLLNRLIHSAVNLLLLRNTIDRREGGYDQNVDIKKRMKETAEIDCHNQNMAL
jgi:hypothetical protein